MTIADAYAKVTRRVEAAAERAGRTPSDVTVVAVAKTFSPQAILEALSAGVTDIGENRARELQEKYAVIGERARWHFVGPLQTNKARTVAGLASLVHSVDRVRLAEALGRSARALGVTRGVLIEVNVARDERKHGVEPSLALSLAQDVAAVQGLDVRGLMAMPPYPLRPEESRPYYRELAALGQQLTELLPEATQLSMGMTRDFEVAIEEGATIVRIGEAIFGPRRA